MFQENFRELIDEQCDGSQKKLSLATGIATATINKWYNGVNEPNCKQLVALADYFEVSIDYLVGRSNDSGIVSVSSNLTEFEDGALTLLRKLTKVQQYQVVGYIQALLSA